MRCVRCRRVVAEGAEPARWFWCAGPQALAPPPELDAWSGSDRYEVDALLGQGGAGQVYRARVRSSGALVAVKMLTGAATRNPRTQQRFARELRVASDLDIAGVVRVSDGEVDGPGPPWVVMEWVRGPSLRAVLQDGPLPWEEAVRLGESLARTLAQLHERGVAHRDVKPSNVLLRTDGEPVLTDFGLVALLADEARRRLTTHAVGTPAYMAPEQVADPLAEHDGRKLDQFALALLVEECVTGHLVDRSALEGSVLSAAHPGLGRVLAKAHHPDPAARFPTMAAFAEDLGRVRAGAAVRARPPGWVFRATRRVRRHRAVVAAVAGTVAGLLALGVGGTWAWERRAEAAALERLTAMESRASALRAEGRDDDALAVFDAFVALPENQGRDALARAWLTRGRRALDAPRLEPAIDHLSRAFVSAVAPSTRAEAAAALDVALRTAGRFRAAHTLRREYSDVVEETDELQLLMEAGDDAALHEALPSNDRRRQLWGRLRRATELPARAKLTGDLDGDGQDDDLFLETPHPLALPLGGFPVRDVVEDRLMPLFGTSLWLDTTADGGLRERLPDGRFVVRCPFDAQGVVPGAAHDGVVWLLAQQHERAILRIDPATCEQTRPFPMLDAMGSYPLSIDLADLDDDGQAEAVVAMGPPRAHGVWVMARTDDGWQERASRRLGYISDLTVVPTAHGPRIVANSAHFHPNESLFPEPPHLGAEAGQHVLEWVGDELVVLDALLSRRLPDARERRWVTAWFGQVDDDGYPDVVTNDGYVYLSTDRREQPFERVPTGFSSLDFIVDIDGDGQVEIGATVDGRTLMLGYGDGPRPSSPAPPPASSFASGDPALEAAQALERVGLSRYAAEAYARIGRGRADDVATDALARAAHMLADERPELAAEAAEEAAARGRTDLVRDAVSLYLRVLRPDRARRVWTAHGAELDPEVRAELDRHVRGMEQRTSLLGEGPPPGAHLSELVRWEASTLDVQTVLGAGPLLRLPLRQTGERVGLHLGLTSDDMEFASELDVHLGNGEGQTLTVRLVQRERGGVLYRFIGEIGWGEEVELSGWREATRFDVQLMELPEASWVAVELRADGELLERTWVPRNRGVGRAWTLDLVAPPVAGLQGQMAAVSIDRLDVVGLVPDDRPVPFRRLPAGASATALAADPEGRPLLHGRLRRDPMLFRELVDELGADAAYGLAAEAFAGSPDDAVGLLPMLAALGDHEVALRNVALAALRAELLCRAGRGPAGRRGLDAVPLPARCEAVRASPSCDAVAPPTCTGGETTHRPDGAR